MIEIMVAVRPEAYTTGSRPTEIIEQVFRIWKN